MLIFLRRLRHKKNGIFYVIRKMAYFMSLRHYCSPQVFKCVKAGNRNRSLKDLDFPKNIYYLLFSLNNICC